LEHFELRAVEIVLVLIECIDNRRSLYIGYDFLKYLYVVFE